MPFTDAQLATQMGSLLVLHRVLTQLQYNSLIARGRTETDVVAAGVGDGRGPFDQYWAALRVWVNANGGNLDQITGATVAGRAGSETISGLTNKSLYNDAFQEVTANLATLKVIKAISNQLRFIEFMVEE